MVFQEILITKTRIAKQYQEQNILTGISVMRELGCEKVSSPGPEPHPGQIPPGKTAVAVGLYFIEPSIALRHSLTSLAYMGSMNLIFVRGGFRGFIGVPMMGELT
jgi:hypothetical protein